MKMKQILAIATVALGTATLTVAICLQGPLNAGDAAVEALHPKLTVNNVELSLTADKATLKAGAKPVLEICAVNTVDRECKAAFGLAMSDSTRAARVSRTLSAPAMLWQVDKTLVLGPREIKRIKIQADKPLPANASFSVMLINEEQAQVAVRPVPVISTPSGTNATVMLQTPMAIGALEFNTLAANR